MHYDIVVQKYHSFHPARLAQSVERKTLNLVVVGSSPTVGIFFCFLLTFFFSVSFADVPEWLMG